MTDEEQETEMAAFQREVRRGATIHRLEAIRRMVALKGSPRTWWAVRALLRNRRKEES